MVFGYLMHSKGERKGEQDEERCLAIVWNLIVALVGSDSSDSPHEKLCLERLCFKLIEGRLDKLSYLAELHKRQFARLAEFDLADFKTAEEIGYLESDFGLDLLALADCIITYTLKSHTCRRLLQDQGFPADSANLFLLDNFGKELVDQLGLVMDLHQRRLVDTSQQLRLVQ